MTARSQGNLYMQLQQAHLTDEARMVNARGLTPTDDVDGVDNMEGDAA